MGKTSIEWTDASWNPIVGCTEVSPGCANCYAARLAATRLRNTSQYKNLASITSDAGKFKREDDRPRWNGQVRVLPERLDEPLHWKKPRRIFVCDMGDLFHEGVPSGEIARIFGIIARCPQHTFQVLTKRAARMKQFFEVATLDIGDTVKSHPELTPTQLRVGIGTTCNWSLPNVWLGVSVENQHFADERIPLLLDTPAAVRFISAEPLFGPVDFGEPIRQWCRDHQLEERTTSLDWIIAGGESGPHARPMHPDWVRGIRDWCQSRTVPFFFKQWGEWGSGGGHPPGTPGKFHILGNNNLPISAAVDGYPRAFDSFGSCVQERLGKKKAGRLLDGREWNEFPVPTP